ncbi:Endonuclease/Exonuclease/phosphatase family protein [Phaeobacter italicus]|uniref:Endonuclease/Exonuclease/phosphatase family protein n=1 Tax=Phaeobacter italicus TaxID=481446 RepID=A0A0H5CWB5_9RHOB|nr:endonuclease/exonuclease/phosphatase family protein [Phaeobacter italicus]CRL09247.1 Endonuclease/Exonuclease/phosphatase family protein [Phaeobacter italicus]
MRLVTYNVEWFSALFDRADRLVLDGKLSGRHGIDRATQARALAKVFTALDADGIMVIEAPDTNSRQQSVRALEHFAAEAGLRAREAISGFSNDTQQEISFLYDPDVMDAVHTPGQNDAAPRFDGVFHIDLDIDPQKDEVPFSKPPLELTVKTKGGTSLALIGAHLKSKAPHGARTPAAVTTLSIANRRKQLAQAIWLRRRIDQRLAEGQDVIVLGDLNDGPGLDQYEKLFNRSSVEIVMNSDLHDPHAQSLLAPRLRVLPSTARFYNKETRRYFSALLDYIMLSPGLMRHQPRWRIWHPFEDAACYEDAPLREALLQASDHFPVSLDIDLP